VVRDKKPSDMDGALILGDDAREDSRRDSQRDSHDDQSAAPRSEPPAELPEDGKGELAAEMVNEIVSRMSLKVDVSIREDGEEVIIDIAGDDAGRVIGKKGQTLDALQFIINKIVNRFPEGRRHIVLDSGDYRERRESGLASLARREAKRAIAQSRIITLEPMSPRDRRVVHLSLAKFPGVSTRSDGQGSERRVRIIPARVQGRGGPRRPMQDRDRGPDHRGPDHRERPLREREHDLTAREAGEHSRDDRED
jgi:spoIIIJ-associated protein